MHKIELPCVYHNSPNMPREQQYEEEDKLLRRKWEQDFENGKIQEGNITPERS